MESLNLNLYNILKNDYNLSELKAQEFAKAINEEVQNDIKSENYDFKSAIKDDFHKIDLRIETVRGEIKDSKNDIIKWLFAFWVTIILMLVANFFINK